ncbi:2-C-methyl-D-erythritol 2,4-cyclodiphosphate synthase [Candidatus Halobeggiatoa sp. HSG11]|nr:2-C-methyl-D-erythritol 2,4-cyclodiphosphate synthase [Candidatus Halobeggiatoa sp. HSG11]
MKIKTGLGQDSHRFQDNSINFKELILGGVKFENNLSLQGNSDADVVLHALCNAISGVTGVNILGKISDDLCAKGIIDSSVYVQEALKYLCNWQICHVSFSFECQVPKITPKISEMKYTISKLLELQIQDIAITATSGEGLTAFGRGEGIQVFCIVTAINDT